MEKDFQDKIADIVEGKLSKKETSALVASLKQALNRDMGAEDEQFFRQLTYEMTGDVKELALMIIELRRGLKTKIQPEINDIATKYIPQASDQLEGVIETLEMAANKLMDNLEIMQDHAVKMEKMVADLKEGRIRVPGGKKGVIAVDIDPATVKTLAPLIYFMESNIQSYNPLISDSFVQMSFQDLTGQRIKRIMGLVGQMEKRLRDMVIGFGIKLSEHEKNPDITKEELDRAVEEKAAELAGPQKQGQGLDQSGIDDLLAGL